MRTRNPRSPLGLVDELARIAGRAEPPPIADGEARWIVERALDGEARAPAKRRPIVWAFAFAMAVAVVLAWLAPRASNAPSDANVLHVTLPTGDRLTGVAGAQFDVERLASTDRRLRLHHGLVLFDVAHVATGQRFSVATPQLVATAKGTVFSVETDTTSSRVRVYEGIVEVEQGGDEHLLAAGAVWDSATHTTAIALARPAAIAPSIETAIRERAAAPAPIEPVIVPPPPISAPAIAAAPARAPEPAPIVHAPAPAPAPADPAELARLLGVAQAELADGKLADALATANLAKTRGELHGAWWLVVGDASRGLGHADDAAEAFDRAARDLSGADRAEAGYSAAYVRFHDLSEPVIALTSLIVSRADDEGSVLEERALGLHAQILDTLGRKREAHDLAVRYLARFPKSDLGAYMRGLAK